MTVYVVMVLDDQFEDGFSMSIHWTFNGAAEALSKLQAQGFDDAFVETREVQE